MSWFSKPQTVAAAEPSASEQVRQKMSTLEREIERAEADLQRVCVQAALSEDPTIGQVEIAKLTELRTHRDLLSNALRAALEAEKDAAGRLSEREFQARRRSLAQKIGQFTRDAATLSQSLAATRDAQRRMVATAAGIVSLLPASLRDDFERRLGAGYLHSLAELEMTRLCDGGQQAIGARPVVSARDADGQITPLAQVIEELCGNVRAGFERCGPAQPKASQQPVEEPANA